MGSVPSNLFNAGIYQSLIQAGYDPNQALAQSQNNVTATAAPSQQDSFTPSNYLFSGSAVPVANQSISAGITAPYPLVETADAPTVALLEVFPDDPFNEGGIDGHDDAVSQTLNSFAPEANSKTYSFYESTTSPPAANGDIAPFGSISEINQTIDATGFEVFNDASQKVQQVMQADPSTDVINMSLALSRKGLYQGIMDSAVNADPQAGMQLASGLGINPADLQAYYSDPDFADPQTRVNIQSPAKSRIENAIAQYVDSRFDAPAQAGQQNFQAGLAEWQQVTGQLAAQGTTVVVAAGNDHAIPGFESTVQNGSEFNLLAMSDNVISVAASTDNSLNGTPASFSSRGGGQFLPTLSADGTDIQVTLDGQQQTVDGTSFSTPTVAAAVAKLKAQNPDLTFEQIKTILTSTADDTTATAEEEGAGILNFQGAISALGGSSSTPTIVNQSPFQLSETPPSSNTTSISTQLLDLCRALLGG